MTSLAAVAAGGIDRTLVVRAAAGDHDAFEQLADVRIERAFRLALAILRNESDARDAVQDAFIAAWRELPRLRDLGQFDPWLERIVVNRCRSVLRHRNVVRVREVAIETEDADSGEHRRSPLARYGTGGGQEGITESDAIRRAFGRLDPDARILLVLHHVEGRAVAELATLLGAPEGTIKWRLHAARKALERALQRESR